MKKLMKSKKRDSVLFFCLMTLFSLVIAAGILYAVLFLNGILPSRDPVQTETELFRVLVRVLPGNGEDDGLSALVEYDPAYQKLTITPDAGEPEEQEAHFLRMSADSFCRIVDKAGGISLTGADGKTAVLSGEEAYAYALGGGTGSREKDEAALFSAFLETLRLHAHDEVFALKLLAFAFPKTETDISLKEASAVGKNMLKADRIEMEVSYD